ncbi:MAG TPA: alpha-ketoglutarate-dependent dioxygenase AlkB [Pyrinomonadaceae bacterium]|nr:alpha-ketoglutarate-dependent dioxygenase AlkB [Pyrinomonadaceae bacterium]
MPAPRKTTRITSPPEGFLYGDEFITTDEENELASHIRNLPLKEFEFQGYEARRRVISFGWRYNFGDAAITRADPIPKFLLPLRTRAAQFAGLEPDDFPHVLVTEYSAGTPIGWHRDRGVFADVVGVSLLSGCPFRLRRRTPEGWERFTLTLEPRSVYLLRGVVRDQWEHSIPAVESLRYSVTFRSLRSQTHAVQS